MIKWFLLAHVIVWFIRVTSTWRLQELQGLC